MCRSINRKCYLIHYDWLELLLVQVFLVRPGTNVRQPVPSAPTTARRENSSSVVSLPAPSLDPSVFTPCAFAVVTPSTVPSVLRLVTSHGHLSMSRERPGLSVL